MDFKTDKPIYLQIADYLCEQILKKQWEAGARIPSVRELSAQVAVNPNTAVRAYELLENQTIIFNKRGIGFFVDIDAVSKIKEIYRSRFLEEEVPVFLAKLKLLEIPVKDILK